MPRERLDLPGIPWSRVSPRLVWTELVTVLVVGVVITAGCFLIGVAFRGSSPTTALVWTLIGLAAAVVTALVAAFTPRRIRSIGYALRDDDLVVRRGLMFQRFIAVPYGRMQLVDISRGPLGRALGLSDLRFVTAAASTNVRLPGLPEADADRLRDELVAMAESRRVGL
ncbi:PH domain-containing protein [Curtobacterium sp. MCBD17_034]|uniref:PH domain-containing protein n=1 Tax=unclassified Curtobacterium TaxID=257496 RepID=UPI000DA98B0E|nr:MULTISPECIES: PH domain-containing protein [unclassified Curtobacterium]PZE77706.1 PH domain-containing protein [Curtobacterium sp. MCBD17_019]PZF62083.1 PH domain-containing protein [Curtobacterium sp. MCBD17_034]PZF63010.1 PH domain-containing protein [Curtobacterium sp. MCBD17_013]PZM33984.1 PH domain-containing protein [Curtobacterium sp. MCBD17_031]WIB63707.1 PH domain-containing protein [Curtobacterium sp. MCBD17_040]